MNKITGYIQLGEKDHQSLEGKCRMLVERIEIRRTKLLNKFIERIINKKSHSLFHKIDNKEKAIKWMQTHTSCERWDNYYHDIDIKGRCWEYLAKKYAQIFSNLNKETFFINVDDFVNLKEGFKFHKINYE